MSDQDEKKVQDLIENSIKLGRCIDKIVAIRPLEQFGIMAAEETPARFVMAADRAGDRPMAMVLYVVGADAIDVVVRSIQFGLDLALGMQTRIRETNANCPVHGAKPPSGESIN